MKFKERLFPKEALLKAAYHFIDKYYVHIDLEDENYIVNFTPKKSDFNGNEEHEFENELLAQTVRYNVYLQTHTIREILMARAMSSTITGSNTEYEKEKIPDNTDNLEDILTDWFKKNEE